MVTPSFIVFRRCSSLLSSSVMQALAKAVEAAAVQLPCFIRNVFFWTKKASVSSALEPLHSCSLF